MTDRSIFLRLGVRDADRAVRDLAQFGERGQRAIERVGNAATPVSRSLQVLDRATGELGGRMRSLAGQGGAAAALIGGLGPAGLAAAAGIGGAVVAFRQFNQAVAQADQLQKLADRIGFNVEALQEYRFAAARSGLATAEVDKGLESFTRRLADARRGQGELKKVVDEYNISLTDSAGNQRAAEAVLRDVATAMGSTSDEADRLLIAYNAFGRSGVSFANLFKDGAEAVDDLRARARELGLVLSEDMTRDAERARDALDTFGEVIGINVNRVLLRLAPAAAAATEALADLFALFGDGGDASPARSLEDAREELGLLTRELADLKRQRDALGEPSDDDALPTITARQDLTAQILQIEERIAVERAFIETAERSAKQAKDLEQSRSDAANAEKIKAATAALAALRGELDETVAIEAERAEKLAELAEVADALNLSDADRAELIDLLNEKYDQRLEKLDREVEVERASIETKSELERRVDALQRTYRGADTALSDYSAAVRDLNLALRQGLLDEEEHSDLVDRAAAAYDRATSAADQYGAAVTRSSLAVTRSRAGGGLGEDLLRSGGRSLISAATGGGSGFDIGGIALRQIAGRGVDSLIDGILEGGSGVGSILRNIGGSIVSEISGVGAAISSTLASTFPQLGVSLANALGISAPIGLGGYGTAGAVASQSALAAAGFSAALPGIGIALAGIGMLASRIFGPGASSGPALGASFEVADGSLRTRHVGVDNGADIEDAEAVADGIRDLIGQVLDRIGGRLLPGAFAGEVGYANGRFANAISSPGIAPGDARSGRSPDLRTFDSVEGAVGDFVVRSLRDAFDRGLIEGVAENTRGVVEAVLSRLERDGGSTAETAGEALDFAIGFTEAVDRMTAAGDAAETQLLGLATAAEQAGASAADQVSAFLDNAERFFGRVERPVGGIDAAGRVDVSRARTFTDDEGREGFELNGERYVYQITSDPGDEYTERAFVNQSTGAAILERTIEAALRSLADRGVTADGSEGVTIDEGDPDRLTAAQEAAENYVDALLGLADADTDPLTGFALQLETGLESIDAMRGAVEALGLSAEAVDAKLAEAREGLRTSIGEDFDQSIADQIEAATDPNRAALRGLIEAFDALDDQAEAVGGNLDQVATLRLERFGSALAELAGQGAALADLEATLVSLGLTAADAAELIEAAETEIAGGGSASAVGSFDDTVAAELLAITDPAEAALSTVIARFADLREQAEDLGGDVDQVGDLRTARLGQVLADLLGQGSTIEDLSAALADLGITGDDAADALAAAATASAATATALQGDLRARALGLADPRAGRLAGIVAEYEAALSTLNAAGQDTTAADALFALEVAGLAREEEAEAIRETLDARRDEIAEIERSVDQFDGLIASIGRTRADLRIDRSLSPLSPTLALADARAQFNAAASAGAAGDVDAAARADALASQVLSLGRDVLASGPGYSDLFAEIDSGLASVQGGLQSELDVQRDQLRELETIRDTLDRRLGDLTASTDTADPSTSLAGLRRVGDQYVNAAGYDLGRNPAAAVAINAALIEAGLDPISGFGERQADMRRASDAEVDQILRNLGYESGGDFAGGYRVVGEGGIEIEKTGPSRIHSAAQTLQFFEAAGASAGLQVEALGRIEGLLGALVGVLTRQGETIEGLIASARGRGYGFQGV